MALVLNVSISGFLIYYIYSKPRVGNSRCLNKYDIHKKVLIKQKQKHYYNDEERAQLLAVSTKEELSSLAGQTLYPIFLSLLIG